MIQTENASNFHSILEPVTTVNSGQMFLWEKYQNEWYGVYSNHILKFSICEDNSLFFDSFPKLNHWEEIVFRLDDDIDYIYSLFESDPTVSQLFRTYSGLRLMRQDPYQCMISFACSSNTNIAMIKQMLRNLCRKFGKKTQVDKKTFFTFPTVRNLCNASINELCSCGTGYRAKTIKSIVENIVSGSLTINELYHCNYDEAKKKLLSIYGIGNKIADCILLFSLEKIEAFPIDVWISRSLYSYYSKLFNGQNLRLNLKSTKLTANQYDVVSKIMRQHFGKYAGYAQQYLYFHMRQEANRKW
ncbi:MAG: DNA repair protein [Nitrosopumilales archaeon]|nr:MAG: DNA repair protein [Nitrosopumilales archaeon]